MSNKEVLDKGFAKAHDIIEEALVSSLKKSCMDLLKEVEFHRGYEGFTGQTQTSYMGGLYIDGRLAAIFNQHNWLQRPRRSKVPLNKFVYLEDPYEGEARGIRGSVDIDEPSGATLSLRMLREYKPPSKGIAIMVTTGTEYSELLEVIKGLDVLTGTFKEAAEILSHNWKKIED